VDKYAEMLRIAEGEMGIAELPGDENTARILEYHAETSLGATSDAVPWCSSFVNWVVIKAGLKGTKSAAAQSWLRWGVELETPVKGCIVVFSRVSGGHVGFFVGETDKHIFCLGGNQRDSVNISAYKKERFLSYRGIPAQADG